MYNPLQPHNVFSDQHDQFVIYKETKLKELMDIVICMWESETLKDIVTEKDAIIVDGCIDLIVDITNRSIFYCGMSKTEFNYRPKYPEKYIGFRFKPGAFVALTGLDASAAMDDYLPLQQVDKDFNKQSFFNLDYEEMKKFIIHYLLKKKMKIKNYEYIYLFDYLYECKFASTKELYEHLKLSPRQVQRQFKKHYGLTPQMVLSVIKFQHSLINLTLDPTSREELVDHYYDQSHFINEFKKNIGLTPLEFIHISKKRKESQLSNTQEKN